MKSKTLFHLSLLLFLFSGSCAVRESPPGGPEDKTPPTIVGIEPQTGSTDLPAGSAFTITFSKPMKKAETEGAVFLSPVFWGYPKTRWSGKRLTVAPPAILRANTTYILTVGANAVDYHGNKMGRSFSYAFSTGATIDTGSISGAVFSEEKGRIFYDIWAYTINDTSGTDFWLRIPDYATQVDSLGGFTISNLGNAEYLVIAIDDKNDDLFWDPSSESMGLPPFLISLTHEQSFKGIVLRPARRDTSLAYISKVEPLSQHKIAVEYSQPPVESMKLDTVSYRITSPDTSGELPVLGLYIGDDQKLILETGPQVAGRPYKLLPVRMLTIWGVPFDTSGGRFTGTASPDTAGPRLLSTMPPNGSSYVYEDSVIEMTFSQHVRALRFAEAVSVVADSTDTLSFIPIWTAPNQIRLRAPGRIPREKSVRVSLAPAGVFDVFNNPMPDSVVEFSFRLPPADTVGGITAQVEPNPAAPVIGILSRFAGSGEPYESQAKKSGAITFDAVLPGTYRFEFFEDSDGNGEWSPGVVSPFKPAELFSFLADTLKVRSRWTTDIGSVSLPSTNQ